MTHESRESALRFACPACAQQPQEWCADWKDGVGMVEKRGWIHPERFGLDTEGQQATPEQFRAATLKALGGII